jgi:hypothetical protein
MQTHGRSGLFGLFQQSSQTEKLAQHLQTPLMALKIRETEKSQQ